MSGVIRPEMWALLCRLRRYLYTNKTQCFAKQWEIGGRLCVTVTKRILTKRILAQRILTKRILTQRILSLNVYSTERILNILYTNGVFLSGVPYTIALKRVLIENFFYEGRS
jgi:hypothetical protein